MPIVLHLLHSCFPQQNYIRNRERVERALPAIYGKTEPPLAGFREGLRGLRISVWRRWRPDFTTVVPTKWFDNRLFTGGSCGEAEDGVLGGRPGGDSGDSGDNFSMRRGQVRRAVLKMLFILNLTPRKKSCMSEMSIV